MKKKLILVFMSLFLFSMLLSFPVSAEGDTNGTSATQDTSSQETTTEEPTTAPEPVRYDLNLDGKVTVADARLALRLAVHLQEATAHEQKEGDYDGDGTVTVRDARMILRIAVGIGTAAPSSHILDLQAVSQFPNYPTGCESVSTVMILNYLGINITIDEFIDKYLDKGSTPTSYSGVWYSDDPRKVFLGDPRSENSWGIHPEGIKVTLEKFIDKSAYDILMPENKTLAQLCTEYIDNDIPVLVCITADMQEVTKRRSLNIILDKTINANGTTTINLTGEQVEWVSPFHTSVLIGYDAQYYYFSDCYNGAIVKYDRATSERLYADVGMKNLVVSPK